MGDTATLPEQAVKELRLENLVQIQLDKGKIPDGHEYEFLGIGEITIHYDAKLVVKGESPLMAQAARMLGTEGLPSAQRTTYTNAHLEGKVPIEATHYCLGKRTAQNEATRKEAFSYDIIPIVFLKTNDNKSLSS